jgi:hypothetical protein
MTRNDYAGFTTVAAAVALLSGASALMGSKAKLRASERVATTGTAMKREIVIFVSGLAASDEWKF